MSTASEELQSLVSRDLDGDLSSEERRVLDDALAASPALRADADAMREVSDWVRGWSARPVEIDWEAHARLIDARCGDREATGEASRLDDLLARWARREVAFDGAAHTGAVMGRIDGGSARAGGSARWSRIIRLGVPLAAAAVLALALIADPWDTRVPHLPDLGNVPVSDNREGLDSTTLLTADVPICIVEFDRLAAPALPLAPRVRSGVSFTAFGLAAVSVASSPGS